MGSFDMRSETSGNILCRLTTRLWQAHPRQHHDHRGRKHNVEGENTFQCFLHGAIFITHTGGHSTGEREPRFPPRFQREDEGIPPCYPRVLQCIRECNGNQRRARFLSKRTEREQLPYQRCRQLCRPRCRRCFAGTRSSSSSERYSHRTERDVPTAAVSMEIPTLTRQK